MDMKIAVWLTVFLLAAAPWCRAGEPGDATAGEKGLTRGQKVMLLNGAGLALLTVWGAAVWEYGERDCPMAQNEGFFGEDTKHGGMDKLGHAFTGHLIALETARAYARWGYDQPDAAWMGLGSSLFFTTMMEVGDSFSAFGLSPEDLAANVMGAGLGFAMARWPEIPRFLDFRMEYRPPLDREPGDFITDYKRMRYHLALKLAGFGWARDNLFRYLEIHAGYRTHGFMGTTGDPERTVFLGAGLNLAELLGKGPLTRVFDYVQAPHAYLAGEKTFR